MPLHSLSVQVSYFSHLIQSNPEWEYAGVYADKGITGTSILHRDEFNRLISDCDAGKIDLVFAKSISRFARDTVDCLNAVRNLKGIGVEVQFEREGISTLSTDGELLLTLLASFAQAESESISESIKWVTRKRFERGIPNGHKAPYGYRWDGEMYRVIPEQGEVVKYIFERYLAGDSGYMIAKTLKEQGVVGQYGVPMVDTTVREIVSNISYTGTMILQKYFFTDGHVRKKNRGELPRYAVEEMFEPLISVPDFERAQVIRRQRAELSSNANVRLTRFSGLVKCGACGCGVSRRTSGNKKRWVCNTRERKGMSVCGTKPIPETELETAADDIMGPMDDSVFRKLVRRISIYDKRVEFEMKDGKVETWQRK